MMWGEGKPVNWKPVLEQASGQWIVAMLRSRGAMQLSIMGRVQLAGDFLELHNGGHRNIIPLCDVFYVTLLSQTEQERITIEMMNHTPITGERE